MSGRATAANAYPARKSRANLRILLPRFRICLAELLESCNLFWCADFAGHQETRACGGAGAWGKPKAGVFRQLIASSLYWRFGRSRALLGLGDDEDCAPAAAVDFSLRLIVRCDERPLEWLAAGARLFKVCCRLHPAWHSPKVDPQRGLKWVRSVTGPGRSRNQRSGNAEFAWALGGTPGAFFFCRRGLVVQLLESYLSILVRDRSYSYRWIRAPQIDHWHPDSPKPICT